MSNGASSQSQRTTSRGKYGSSFPTPAEESRRQKSPKSSSHFSRRRARREPAWGCSSPSRSSKTIAAPSQHKPINAERVSQSASLFRLLLGAGNHDDVTPRLFLIFDLEIRS